MMTTTTITIIIIIIRAAGGWIVEYNYGGGSKSKTKSIRRDCVFFAFARKRPAAVLYTHIACTL